MLFDHVCGGVTAAALLLSAGTAEGHRIMWIPMCHGGSVPLSLPLDGRAPIKRSPATCHAPCLARRKDQD